MLAEKFDRIIAHLRHRECRENVPFLWEKPRLGRAAALPQNANERLRIFLKWHSPVPFPVDDQDRRHVFDAFRFSIPNTASVFHDGADRGIVRSRGQSQESAQGVAINSDRRWIRAVPLRKLDAVADGLEPDGKFFCMPASKATIVPVRLK